MGLDFTSAAWLALRRQLEDDLQSARSRNDGNLSMEDTWKVRGEIAYIKRLLDLPDKVAREVAVPPEL